jgi:hypothetical protein
MWAVTQPPPRRFSENHHFVWVATEGGRAQPSTCNGTTIASGNACATSMTSFVSVVRWKGPRVRAAPAMHHQACSQAAGDLRNPMVPNGISGNVQRSNFPIVRGNQEIRDLSRRRFDACRSVASRCRGDMQHIASRLRSAWWLPTTPDLRCWTRAVPVTVVKTRAAFCKKLCARSRLSKCCP